MSSESVLALVVVCGDVDWGTSPLETSCTLSACTLTGVESRRVPGEWIMDAEFSSHSLFVEGYEQS